MTNAMISGHSPETPIVRMTAPMPTSCRAIYGIVAAMPVMAIISASVGEPWRPRTKTAGVTHAGPWAAERGRRHVAVAVGERLEPGRHDELHREDDDRVRHREEPERAGAEQQRRD